MAMAASVEESTFDFRDWNFVSTVIRRMREVPVTSSLFAFTISIGSMIAHRFHAALLAGFEDIGCSHVTPHSDTFKHVVIVSK